MDKSYTHSTVTLKKWLQTAQGLEALFNSLSDAVILLDSDCKVVMWNSGAEEISGYTARESMGRCVLDVFPLDPGENCADQLRSRLGGIKNEKNEEMNIVARSGLRLTIEVTVSPVRDKGGSLLGYIVIARDISEKKEFERHLVRMERLHALGEMAAGVAHEFNNVLAAILGRVELLLATTPDPSLKKSFSILRKTALDGAAVIRRIQNFGRALPEEATALLDLNSLVREALEVTEPKWIREAHSRGVPISVETDLKQLPPVRGESAQLREVLTNLILNAVDAMPEGGVLTIRTFSQDESVFVEVRDTGEGMLEEVRNRAFEPFFTTKGDRGSGLGLSIAYGIICRHGGEIGVSSEPGHGSTFLIRLPAASQDHQEIERAGSEVAATHRDGLRILVIDDEESVASILSLMLEQCGHQAVKAGSGHEGLTLARSESWDLVLTDLGMPGMSGWEVAAGIKETSPEIPVVLVTGWNLSVPEDRLKERGIDYLLRKPFDLDDLKKALEVTCNAG